MLRRALGFTLILPPLLAGCGGSGGSSARDFRVLPASVANPSAQAVSADGSVVAGIYFTGPLTIHPAAAVWTNGRELGSSEVSFRSAEAVNGDGSVIVGSGLAAGIGSDVVAVRWTKVSGATQITMPTPTLNSFASGVDDTGTIIVGGESSTTDGVPHAFRWVNGTVTILPALLGETSSQANAVSSEGTVTVGQAGAHAVKWLGTEAPVAL